MTRSTASSALGPHAAAIKAAELLRVRERLLREIQKKKRQLEAATEHASAEAESSVRQMAPLVERHRAVVRKLTAIFDELLEAGRLPQRARNQIGRFRRALELQGVLPPLAGDEDEAAASAWSFDASEDDEPFRDEPRRRPAQPHVEGAEQIGQERRSLRELFRSLARAVHPDQARHDAERERRTAVMKEVTRAYEDGDLARLLELESAWRGEQAISDTGDPEARCRELSRLNRELLKQVRELTRRIRDVKQAAREASEGIPADELVALATRELDELSAVYEVLRDFRDGKLTLSDLLRGPTRPPAPKRPRSRAAARRPW